VFVFGEEHVWKEAHVSEHEHTTHVSFPSWHSAVHITKTITQLSSHCTDVSLYTPNTIGIVLLEFPWKTLCSAFVQFVRHNLKVSQHCCVFNCRLATNVSSAVFQFTSLLNSTCSAPPVHNVAI
jgi:hypothetical protein